MPTDGLTYTQEMRNSSEHRASVIVASANAVAAMEESRRVHSNYFTDRDGDSEYVAEMGVAVAAEGASLLAQKSAASSLKLVEDAINEYNSDDDCLQTIDPKIAAAKAAAAYANKAAQEAAARITEMVQLDVAMYDARNAVSVANALRKAITTSFLSSNAASHGSDNIAEAVALTTKASYALKSQCNRIDIQGGAEAAATVAIDKAAAAAKAAEKAAADCGMRLRRTPLVFFKCFPADAE
jgi:hypothetical protein